MEREILLDYKDFITKKSTFGSIALILPDTPQSFLKFPTIILKEQDSNDNINGMSLDRQEYIENKTYQVEFYTKSVVINKTKYESREIINELKDLTDYYFRNIGFIKESSTRGEYIDITINRHINLYSAKINNWNKNII